MKKAVAIEAGTAVKFQLEQQFLHEEAKLAYLSDELDKIESALQSSDLCKYTVIWRLEIRISSPRKQEK